jgi:anti-anti-sigma factor
MTVWTRNCDAAERRDSSFVLGGTAMQTVPVYRVGDVLERITTVAPRPRFPVVVRAPRELDLLSGSQLVATVARVVARPPVPDVHLLLDAVEFIDVAGVRALIECREVVRARYAELYFVDECPALRRIIDLVPDLGAMYEGDR